MLMLKNRHAPKLSGANCYAKLSHSKQLLKNIYPVMLAQFCSLPKKIRTVHTQKTPKNHQLYATAATKKKDIATEWRIQSTLRQSLMASVSKSQVVDSTPV